MANSDTKLYCGYGSNLWLNQMALRCPSSPYVGVARISGFHWIINSRGYANAVSSSDSSDVIYGLVYRLTRADEAQIDINEGVPEYYTKETMKAEFWTARDGDRVDIADGGEEKELMLCIDRKRIEVGSPKEEYVHRINMGINDAVKKGVPHEYVASVMRKFVPEESLEGAQKVADKQALIFEDER